MKLNLHMLSDVLAQWNFQGTHIDPPAVRNLVYPIVLDESTTLLDEHVLYLARSDLLSEALDFSGHPSILCIGKPPQNWLKAKCNILYTKADLTVNALINVVSREFFRYQKWENDLQEAIEQNLPLQELATRTGTIIHNPISVMTSSLHVICGNLPEADQETPLYKKYKESFSLQEGYVVDVENSSDFVTDSEFEKLFDARGPSIHEKGWYGFRVLYCNIVVEQTVVATAIIDEILSEFSPRDFALIEIWCTFLEKGIKSDTAHSFSHLREYGEILNAMLCPVLPSQIEINDFLKEYRWHMNDEYVCVVIKQRVSDIATALKPLAIGLAAITGNDCYTIKGSDLVFIYNLTRDRSTRDEIQERILPLLRNKLLIASISTSFYSFEDLYYYYQQALTARELGEMKDPSKWYYRYEDYQIDFLLQKYQQQTIPETLIPNGLKKLLNLDKERGSNYVQTLRAYLDCERNVAETIRAIFVHRNTFLYRIEKIQKILGIDLNNVDNRIILQLALRIIEQEKL